MAGYFLTPFKGNTSISCETYDEIAVAFHNSWGYEVLIQMHSHPVDAGFSLFDLNNISSLNESNGLRVDMMVVAPKANSTTSTVMQLWGNEAPHSDLNYYRYGKSELTKYQTGSGEPVYLSNELWSRKTMAYYGSDLIYFY